MLLARAGRVLVIGLSDRNLELLREGRPIQVDLAALGMEGRIFVFHRSTEAEMRAELADMIGPDTDYRDTTRKQ
jgi:hypothetical protein